MFDAIHENVSQLVMIRESHRNTKIAKITTSQDMHYSTNGLDIRTPNVLSLNCGQQANEAAHSMNKQKYELELISKTLDCSSILRVNRTLDAFAVNL